jgi:hypothetical protein
MCGEKMDDKNNIQWGAFCGGILPSTFEQLNVKDICGECVDSIKTAIQFEPNPQLAQIYNDYSFDIEDIITVGGNQYAIQLVSYQNKLINIVAIALSTEEVSIDYTPNEKYSVDENIKQAISNIYDCTGRCR